MCLVGESYIKTMRSIHPLSIHTCGLQGAPRGKLGNTCFRHHSVSFLNPWGMLDDKKACNWILYLPQTLARDFCNASFYLQKQDCNLEILVFWAILGVVCTWAKGQSGTHGKVLFIPFSPYAQCVVALLVALAPLGGSCVLGGSNCTYSHFVPPFSCLTMLGGM